MLLLLVAKDNKTIIYLFTVDWTVSKSHLELFILKLKVHLLLLLIVILFVYAQLGLWTATVATLVIN